jgi:hypothetical protein
MGGGDVGAIPIISLFFLISILYPSSCQLHKTFFLRR